MFADSQDYLRRVNAINQAIGRFSVGNNGEAPEVVGVCPELLELMILRYNEAFYPQPVGSHEPKLKLSGVDIKHQYWEDKDFVLYPKLSDYKYASNRYSLRNALATNGEGFSKGKSSQERKFRLYEEAEGFASMCGIPDATWHNVVKEYLEEFPEAPED